MGRVVVARRSGAVLSEAIDFTRSELYNDRALLS